MTKPAIKWVSGCDELFPVLSVVDPELMLSVPPQLTAFQGFDAFFHASEGYLASVATPVSDALALQSMRLLSIYLPRAVADGSDLEARTNVALANTLSGMSSRPRAVSPSIRSNTR